MTHDDRDQYHRHLGWPLIIAAWIVTFLVIWSGLEALR